MRKRVFCVFAVCVTLLVCVSCIAKDPVEFVDIQNLEVNDNESVSAVDSIMEYEEVVVEKPWESGGKQPREYTWKEYNELTTGQQIAFQKSFDDIEAFDEWFQVVHVDAIEKPWEHEETPPQDYLWEEYNALTAEQQIAFLKSFESIESFDSWLQENEPKNFEIPWAEEKKKLEAYTWEEYNAFTAEQQMAFQNSFDSVDSFSTWMQQAQREESDIPVENNDEAIKAYTWEEYERLTAEEQMEFQRSFASIEDFDRWLQKVQNEGSANPWETDGKQPKDYTWKEFEALTVAQQMAFQRSFASIDAFADWVEVNQPK